MSSNTPEPTKSTASTGASAIEFEPPLACVRRILKNALPGSTNVGKDASAAFARACGIFVIYITACANDFARESRRQTITANDVLAAVKELDFEEFTPHLTAFLERHRAAEKSKRDAKAKAAKASASAAEAEEVPDDPETPDPKRQKIADSKEVEAEVEEEGAKPIEEEATEVAVEVQATEAAADEPASEQATATEAAPVEEGS